MSQIVFGDWLQADQVGFVKCAKEILGSYILSLKFRLNMNFPFWLQITETPFFYRSCIFFIAGYLFILTRQLFNMFTTLTGCINKVLCF